MTEKQFNALNEVEQWQWVLDNKNKIQQVTLDNDNTSIMMKDSEDYYYMHRDCGDRDGVKILLTLIGLNAERC